MEGFTIGQLFALSLRIDVMLREQKLNLEPEIQRRLHSLFMARWDYYHRDIMSASRILHHHTARLHFEQTDIEELENVLHKVATPEHTYLDIRAEYEKFREDIDNPSSRICKNYAFSEQGLRYSAPDWVDMFMGPYPHLQWAARRIASVATSASACERSWSTEGWLHNERRNRLSQKRVEELMRIRSALTFTEESRPRYEVVPWDLRLVCDEDESPEEDEPDLSFETPEKRPRMAAI